MSKKFVPVMITPFTPQAELDFDMLKKLVDFYKYEIETDESAVYGEGFRKVNYMVTNSSLQETLKEILPRGG